MFFTDFFLLECSNNFKRIMQIWACAVMLFENVQKFIGLLPLNCQSKFISKIIDELVNTVDYFVNLNFKFQNSNSNRRTILSHGMLEVVATRHRLQRLWGRIVTFNFRNQIKSTQIWQCKPPRQMKIIWLQNIFSQ